MAQTLKKRDIVWLSVVSASPACTGIIGGDSKLEAPVSVQAIRPAAGSRSDELPLICDRVVDDFSSDVIGQLPKAWETRKQSELEFARREGAYLVVKDGERRALRARSVSEPITLARGIEQWNLRRYPILAWEWKVTTFPSRANETLSAMDDTAASVAAVWLIGFPFVVRQIRYTYSTVLPPGTRASNRLGHDQLLVLASVTSGSINEWRRVSVNVLRHYQQFFERGDESAPTGIALMTDADDTKSHAAAYYANFRLCRDASESTDESR